MGENERLYIDGREIIGISEGELYLNLEQDTVERDCEITTTYGIVRFKAVFTKEQWYEFVELSKKVGEG